MLDRVRFLLDKFPYIKKIVLLLYIPTLGKLLSYRKNKHFLKYNKDVLVKLDSAFKKADITYWLDFGTLLGAVREKDFILHDLDIDVGMWLSDRSELLEESLKSFGFKKIREISIYKDNLLYGLEGTYSLNKINIDIFYYTKINGNSAYYHDFIPLKGMSRIGTIKKIGGLIPREIILPIESIGKISFKGGDFPAPFPLEEHLIGRYGNGYMVKDTNWNITKGNQQTVRVITDNIGIVTYL